jgi:hypothetical protein
VHALQKEELRSGTCPFRPSFIAWIFRPDGLVIERSIHEACLANQTSGREEREVSCSACVSHQQALSSFHVPTAPHRETRRMYENVGDGRSLPVRVAPI